MATIYHVSKQGIDQQNGAEQTPFLTISKAAAVAMAGDTVLVHAGEYREWVKPQNGGNNDHERITYLAAACERVVIKGSERIQEWTLVEDTLWQVTLDNAMFNGYNPYQQKVAGDWLLKPEEYDVHLGDVYLNGKSFYQAKDWNDLKENPKRTAGFTPIWSEQME